MTSTTKDTLHQIVKTVIYEGYTPCPDAASAPHHQSKQFSFGRVYPEFFCQKHEGHGESCQFQTETLLETGTELPALRITVGFLQPIQREIGAVPRPMAEFPRRGILRFGAIPKLESFGSSYRSWIEAVERQVTVPLKALHGSVEAIFNFDGDCSTEPVFDEDGLMTAVVRRTQSAISGKIIVALKPLKNGLSKISVTILNQSSAPGRSADMQDKVLMSTMAATHVVLEARNGKFVSLWDTPAELKFFAAQCQNVGAWPVLVGAASENERSTMLASPILLYDYPQISRGAVEQSGDLVPQPTESGETTEFLKIEDHARKVHLSDDEFSNRAKSVKSVLIDGVELSAGDRVCIHPSRQADPIDLILTGKTAVIETLEQDVAGQIHLGLILEGDSQGFHNAARDSGYRFFYSADEVEPCKQEAAS